ncbi:hypothetical protein B0H14DRAFT_2748922 [Mycena olivaceomarginata]|nr:hypothetical protein B0H14DRAFT_2748922 [Mycena olivaceomarginata]
MLVSLRARSESLSLDPRIYPRVILGLVIPGLGLNTALLALFGYATWNVVSRRHLNRVSFRLLTYALVAHLVFGVSFVISNFAGYQDWRCSLVAFLTSSSLIFSSCIFFCIALNVPLVVVDGKHYVAGTTLISLICMGIPYASGNLGHVPIPTKMGLCEQELFFNDADPAARSRGLLGIQIIWIVIAVGELGAFLIIVGYLVTHELHLLWRPAHTYSSEGAGSTILKFRNIILRIGLYPLTSCLLIMTTVGIDFYESRKHKMEGFKMTKLVSIAISAGRLLIHSLLAATDPSFIRALQALRHPDTETETQSCRRSGCFSTIVEIPPQTSFDDGESLDNDHVPHECMRGHESSATPNSDLEVGKRWRFYFRHSKPASNLPAADVVSHI